MLAIRKTLRDVVDLSTRTVLLMRWMIRVSSVVPWLWWGRRQLQRTTKACRVLATCTRRYHWRLYG